jgi:hypothetical protein
MRSNERVDPAEWFAKVESLEADLRAMTKSRDNWQRKYGECRQQRKGALDALRRIAEQAETEGEQWAADTAEDALDRLGITTERGQ